MSENAQNPYESPAETGADNVQARFRLRPWFAGALYLALVFDLAVVWSLGFQPFMASLGLFAMSLLGSVFIRRFARIQVRETGIHYEDLVHRVDVPWHRVARVVHRPAKTSIATSSPLVQITVGRRHEAYDLVVGGVAHAQAEFGFKVADFRPSEPPAGA